MRAKYFAIYSCLSLIFISGCAEMHSKANYESPEPNVPDQWTNSIVSEVDSTEHDISRWWKTFNDPYLNSLIETGIENNLDLKSAISRVAQSRLIRAITAGEKSINVNASGFYSQSMPSNNGLETIPSQSAHHSNLHNIGLDASWEIDVFGRISRSIEAADADYQATIEDMYDIESILTAEITSLYIEVRTLQSRLYSAKGNLRTQATTLKLTKDRFEAQIVPEIDVQQAELNLARTESAIPAFEIQIAQSIYALSTLLGMNSGSSLEHLNDSKSLPTPEFVLDTSIPADSVRRRPDVRASERKLCAQTIRIGISEAELYPQFSLSGSFAFEGTQLKHLGYWDSKKWSWGPSVNWDLFNGDRLKNNVLLQKVKTEESLLAYQSTVLKALEEVESSLVAYNKETQRSKILLRSVEAAKKSVELVTDLYRSGLTDFQNVLDTEKSLFEQQDEYAVSNGDVLQNLISLYKAAGGGWKPQPVESEEENDIPGDEAG